MALSLLKIDVSTDYTDSVNLKNKPSQTVSPLVRDNVRTTVENSFWKVMNAIGHQAQLWVSTVRFGRLLYKCPDLSLLT